MIYTIDEIKEKLLPIFESVPIKRAILFGSYARNEQTAKSDVDIVIDSEGKIRGLDFFGVLGDITDSLEKRVDLIEKYQIKEDSPFERTINSEGVILYER